ncbi:P22AR C-terminal domain-containing protein [Haemophilus haemolyticus]|uniref:P22AR C-terminal domain-containing protein n=1 Tax=Haemophilus haemolyticus TaxID=726 RepID=UPI001128AD3A|nr:P22AR C-terminal domain-containing protein [Haemophilus haemolyticus]TPH11516.1 hypothetical protein EUX49_00510 [Haemophilus haemolyticus]
MSNQTQLSTFSFESKSIRTLAINNEPWFVAKDVCDAIGLTNSRMSLIALDEDEKGVSLIYTPSGQQEMNIVSESGMYTLILRCRDAVKKGSIPHRFRKWVTAEVLPTIRKTGKYQLQPQQLALPEPEKKFNFEFTEHELQQLVWAWFALLRGTELCQVLHPALKQIGSYYAAPVHDIAYEYRSTLRQAQKVLERITEKFECEQGNNWRVLKYLRAYNPKATGFQLDIL